MRRKRQKMERTVTLVSGDSRKTLEGPEANRVLENLGSVGLKLNKHPIQQRTRLKQQ